jgi:hypothetical protein
MADRERIIKAMSQIPCDVFIAESKKVTFKLDGNRVLIVHESDSDDVTFTYFYNRKLLAASVANIDDLSAAMIKMVIA